MISDLARLVTYTCPRCGVSLEAETDDWRDWRACPSCGRPARPPVPRRAVVEEPEVLYIGTFATGPGSDFGGINGNGSGAGAGNGLGNGSAIYPSGPPSLSSYGDGGGTVRRVILGGGFFLALFLALVSVVQQNATQAGVFGFLAFILLALLAQSSRRP